MDEIGNDYQANTAEFDEVLGAGRSCDMVCRDLVIAGKRARLWVIDGFGGDTILERMGAFWLSTVERLRMQDFADRCVTFMEVDVSRDRADIVTSVLMGKSLLLIEGLTGAALIDAKSYPSRGVDEPPDGKVLRGSHDGFVEAVVPNMALLRRRIRDPHLTMEGMKVGARSHNDVVLCYLDDAGGPGPAGAAAAKAPGHRRPVSHHGSGERGRGHSPQAVVQPLPQGPLHGAAGHRGRLRHGGGTSS